MTLLVSRVLNSANARQEVTDFVNVVDTVYSTVSISALLKSQVNLSYLEAENLDYLNTDLNNLLPNEFFKRNLLYELKQSGTADYPNLIDNLDMNIARDAQIIDQLVSYDLSLFFPDLFMFDWTQVNEFRSTFVPTTENGENQAINVGTIQIGNIDDLDVCNCNPESPNNFTLIEGDDFTEHFATVVIEDTSHDPWDFTYNHDNNETTYPFGSSGSGDGYGPPPVTNSTVLLDYNFNYLQMPDENYLLTSGIPRMQVKDGWRRWGSSKTRLRLYRAKSIFTVNSNGEIVAQPDTYVQGYNPSRYATKKKRWRTINMEWDPNIRVEGKSQQIVIFQQRSNASSQTANFSLKNNIDAQGNFSTESTTTISHTITHDQSILRESRELDILNLGVYNVDGNPHHAFETINYNGTNQSILKMDQVKFFFEYYYTEL